MAIQQEMVIPEGDFNRPRQIFPTDLKMRSTSHIVITAGPVNARKVICAQTIL